MQLREVSEMRNILIFIVILPILVLAACTSPVDGAAANPVETGYMPVNMGGSNVGYTITGNGRIAGVTTFVWWQTPSDTCVTINGETIHCTER